MKDKIFIQRKPLAALAGTFLLALAVLSPTGTAVADDTVAPLGACDTRVLNRMVTGSSAAWFGVGPAYHSINGTPYVNTVTFKATAGGTLSASVSGTIEGGLSGAIASGKASVSSSITTSVTVSTSAQVSYNIPAGKTGYAQMGTNRYTVNISNFRYSADCKKKTVVSSGILKAPTTLGWKTWVG